MNLTKYTDNAIRKPVWQRLIIRFLFFEAVLCIYIPASSQEKHLVQIKTFDQQLQPVKNIDISINDKEYITIGNRGVAFVELLDSELPLKSVKIKNEQLEAASWNYSKGIVEIIIRKKSYQIIKMLIRDQNNIALANLKVTFNGRKTIAATTNTEGRFEIPVAIDEKVNSANQFNINDYKIVNIQLSEKENVLTVEPIVLAEKKETPQMKSEPVADAAYFKDFDLSKLDSIQSLTVFYAVFKNYQFKDLSAEVRGKLDAKFNQLVGQLEDSIRSRESTFIGKISDSSFVSDDIRNLLSQAALENRTLEAQRQDFDDKIKIISDKLAEGVENLDPATRTRLLSDLSRLETILTQNENRFYKNQNDYRQILNSLKEKFFNLEDLENKLSLSELHRLEEQALFRKRLLLTVSIALVFAVLIVLLVYVGNKLKKQKKALVVANAEINRINENLELLVFRRTKMLEESHHELDTFLYKASHDLRSPICSIIGLCNLATHISNRESKELFEKAGQTAFAMDRLLKKLKIISEINKPSNFSSIKLLYMVEDIKSKFNDVIYKHHIKFSIDCADDLAFYSYPILIKAILFNLMENAIFYSALKDNGTPEVQLTAIVNDDRLLISIFDNGIGVDNNIRNKVFTMFFKGNENSKGNGLGLYIVQKSVQVLEGNVSLESEPDSFTKFVIDLPLKPGETNQRVVYNETEATV